VPPGDGAQIIPNSDGTKAVHRVGVARSPACAAYLAFVEVPEVTPQSASITFYFGVSTSDQLQRPSGATVPVPVIC
jgi:hypothetical protein